MDLTENNKSWSAKKSKLNLKLAELTDHNLLFVKGKNDVMIARLQIILGKTADEMDEILKNL
ncbi:MAG: hypothetical protein ACOH2D_14005 [Gelidibacter sp.]|uniref:general stress protein CsbD n=1 Tax=Gelidibacter sp. TaxID=2018083 RepID=UPI003262CE19